MIKTYYETENMKPDIVANEKENNSCWIKHIACPAENNKVCDKEERIVDRNDRLNWKLKLL